MEELEQSIKYKGTITLTLKREEEVIERRVIPNVFLNVGKSWAIQRLFDDTASVVSGTAAHYFYVGTTASGGAAAATDTTAAITWTNGGQIAFTYASGGIGAMSGTATFITSTANGAITEAGIFAGTPVNAPVTGDGVFIARVLFAAINKTSSDTLQVKWDVSIA